MPYPTAPDAILGLWVALFLMIFIYSYPLYKENLLFRFAEHTFIGTAMAVEVIVAIQTASRMAVTPMVKGELLFAVPIILGIAMYFIYSRQYRWVSRYPIAVLIGVSLGLGMRGALVARIIANSITTITPPKVGDAMGWFNYTYVGIGTILGLMYFLLTIEQKGPFKAPTRIGRWVIMFGLGAFYANTVLFRFSMLSGRAQFLLQVLGIIPM